MRSRLLKFILKHLVKGIAYEDFAETEQLSEKELRVYCSGAKAIVRNPVWQNEIARVKYKQRQAIVEGAHTETELAAGRAVLLMLSRLEKRFEEIASADEEQTPEY